MKNFMRISDILLIFSIIFIMSSCETAENGNSKGNINSPDADISDIAGNEIDPTAADTEIIAILDPPDIEAVDYGGAVATFLERDFSDTYRFKEFGAEEINGDVINDAVYARNLAIEEKYNVKIKAMPSSGDQLNEVQKCVKANDNSISVATNGVVYAFANGLNGYLAKIQDIPYVDCIKPWWQANSIKDTSIGNVNYFIVGDMNMAAYTSIGAMYFNKKLIQDYALENPYDLVLGGKWTFGKLLEMAKNVSSDINGDGMYGEEDSYGLAMLSYGALTFNYGFGVMFATKDKDDMPYLDINESFIAKFQALVEACNETCVLYADEPRFAANSGRTRVPETAFRENRLLFHNESLTRMDIFRDMETDFGVIPMPKFDESQKDYRSFVHQGVSTTVSIPITADLDMMGRILEDTAYYSYKHVRPAFMETSLYTKFTRDERSRDMLDIIINSARYDIALVSGNPLLDDLRAMLTSLDSGKVASTMESKMALYQKNLDSTVKKIFS